jgi:hypothetical protein
MSEYRYCHGTNCHTHHTLGRIRGVKGNKVLRTRKIKIDKWNENTWHGYFCDERCRSEYMQKHLPAIMRLEPRTEPLETSIEVKTVEDTDWRGNPYTYKKIVE